MLKILNRQAGRPLLLGLLLLCFLFSGISCRGLGPEPTRERLQARVEGYIKARNQRDLEALRSYYETPAEARVGNIRYVEGRIESIELGPEGKSATVNLRNTFKVMGFEFKNVKFKARWYWNGRDWFIKVPEQSTPFGGGKKKTGNGGPGHAEGK